MKRAQGKLALVALLIICLFLTGRAETEVRLSNEQVSIWCNPATLEMRFQPKTQPPLVLSDGQGGFGEIAELKQDGKRATWRLPKASVEIAVQLDGEELSMAFRGDKPGNFSWPVMQHLPSVKAWMLPMFEGIFVPAYDARWISFLEKHGPLNTTADLGSPFWGWDCGDFTVTWIATNPFNNELTFTNQSGQLAARFQHEFTRNNPVKEFGFVIQIGKASPIEPAKKYRRWLQERGDFVSMAKKIKRTPEAEKLLGASHIYLWGDEIVSAEDIKDWKEFAKAFKGHGTADNPSYARELWQAMSADIRNQIASLESAQWADRYTKTMVIEELNRLLARGSNATNRAALCLKNSRALADAFPGLLTPLENWGNGVSLKMISRLADAGLDRLWLGTDGWDGLVRRPEMVAAAKQHGYLMGPYDSYHSIHPPSATDTWETAQFDEKLYETGGIVRADGSIRKGFKQKGYMLSPIAARPYLEQRVSGLMQSFHANSWFMDCDGFGEFFDDYSPAHPATQQSDLQERCSRMAWIRDTFGAVIGSEGCSAGVASTIHFAHGVMTPVIGWGDPDLTSKTSKFFLGAYYPPNGPAVFIKPVPTKEEYRYIYFDPRFRLPLFETVFHDSVVATHHWSAASGKFSDQADTVALLELLYQVPPLYHLNLEEFSKRKAPIKKHHDFFSPLHRETGLLPLTGFEWLTPDRLVQRTVFGDSIELVANFRESALSPSDVEKAGVKDISIPACSIVARHRATGKILVFTPGNSK